MPNHSVPCDLNCCMFVFNNCFRAPVLVLVADSASSMIKGDVNINYLN